MELRLDGTDLFAVGLDRPETDAPRPVLVAFPPGDQGPALTRAVFTTTFAGEAQRRGWVAVSPASPDGVLFFEGSERMVGDLLDWIEDQVKPEGGRFHVAGLSNGGISSFRAAVQHPARIASVVAFPGYAAGPDRALLHRLRDIPVSMFVGHHDPAWIEPMRHTARALEEAGGRVSLEVVPGATHVLTRFSDGRRLFDVLDGHRAGRSAGQTGDQS